MQEAAANPMVGSLIFALGGLAGAVFAVWCFMVAVSARAAKKCEAAGV